MSSSEHSLSVPTEAVLVEVEQQRDAAMTELAQWRALAKQLMTERDELAALAEKPRT